MRAAKFLILFALLITLSSCSLFKFSINTGEKALTKEQADTRAMVRGYYSEFSAEVVKAADSIAALNQNSEVVIRSIQWKLNATSACASAVYQTVPEVALVNTWVLAAQMQQMLNSIPNDKLFGAQSNIARAAADSLLIKIVEVAKIVTTPSRYALLADFVHQYTAKNKIKDMNFAKNSLMLEFISFLGGNQAEMATTTGVMSEVLADMNDRVSGYGIQTVNELTWAGEILKVNMKQDSTARSIAAKADSLVLSLHQMAMLLNSSPELLDSLTKSISSEMATLILTFNGGMNMALGTVSSERVALQEYITAERAALMADVEKSSKTIVETAMAELPIMLRKILTYVVIAVLLLFGLPFALGYFIGQRRWSRGKKKQSENNQPE